MKKIVLASAAMGGAALLAFGASGTFAAFSDQDQVSSGVGAGTFLLDARATSATTPDEAVDLLPGEQAQYAYFFQNVSSSRASLSAVYSITSSTENGCLRPERTAGDNCYTSEAGDLGQFATVVGHYATEVSSAANCTIDKATEQNRVGASGVPYPPATLDFAASNRDGYQIAELGPNTGLCLILDIALPADAPGINRVQSDRLTYSATVTLTQIVPAA